VIVLGIEELFRIEDSSILFQGLDLRWYRRARLRILPILLRRWLLHGGKELGEFRGCPHPNAAVVATQDQGQGLRGTQAALPKATLSAAILCPDGGMVDAEASKAFV
jgi:hypothetical protein